MGYEIEITKKAKDFIVDKGWDSQYGARPLKRAIQKYLEDPLAEELIKTKLENGDRITIDYKDSADEVTINFEKGEALQEAKKSK